MNRLFRYIGFFSLALALCFNSACRKEYFDLPNPDTVTNTTFEEQFVSLWHGMDQNYLFWERDTTDWDAMYERYLPVFQEFDRKGNVTNTEFAEVYTKIFGGLIDHHFSLTVQNLSTGAFASVNPGAREVLSRDYYHSTWTEQQVAVVKNMEGVTNYKEWNGDCGNWFAMLPIEGNKKIAYFRFSAFAFSQLQMQVLYGGTNASALDPLKAFYGTVLEGMGPSGLGNNSYVKGIIVDVRGNGGGNLNEIVPLAGSLMQEDLLLGYGRTKEGLGRLDYSVWTPYHIHCPAKHLAEPKPIVVLADCNTGSCGEMLTLIVKSLPNGTFVGERTWGCTGPLLPGQNDLLYSGVFGDLYHTGYYVYTSNFDFVNAQYESLEGKGIEPDIWASYNQELLQYGKDTQLEAAIEHIKSQL